MKTKKWMLTIAALLILACSETTLTAKPSAEPQVENTPEQTETEPSVERSGASPQVDEIIASSNISRDTPGGAVMVINQGEIIHQNGYGLADVKSSTPVIPANIFHLGSVSKQFTALGIMILAERGDLNYNDPIGKHLPELAWTGDEVTIRGLLNHTSGIPDYDENEDLYNNLLALSDQPTNEDVLTALYEESELIYAPGEEFLYSNTGYDVLGALIERISGQTYPEFMQDNIFGLLGMNNTFAVPNAEKLKGANVSLSYWLDDNNEPSAYEPDVLDNINGSGSTYSNLGDMYLYDQALYTDAIVEQSTLAEAFEPATLNNGESSEYGFAWDIGTYNGEAYTAHSGAWLGFTSYYLRFPERQFSVILLFNMDYLEPDEETLAFQIADLYLR